MTLDDFAHLPVLERFGAKKHRLQKNFRRTPFEGAFASPWGRPGLPTPQCELARILLDGPSLPFGPLGAVRGAVRNMIDLALLCDRMDTDKSGALSLEEMLHGDLEATGAMPHRCRKDLGRIQYQLGLFGARWVLECSVRELQSHVTCMMLASISTWLMIRFQQQC